MFVLGFPEQLPAQAQRQLLRLRLHTSQHNLGSLLTVTTSIRSSQVAIVRLLSPSSGSAPRNWMLGILQLTLVLTTCITSLFSLRYIDTIYRLYKSLPWLLYLCRSPRAVTTTTTTTPTPTLTPSPTSPSLEMPNIVNNCAKFYLVHSGDSCDSIEAYENISSVQFASWNLYVDSTCNSLWLGYYVCVGV